MTNTEIAKSKAPKWAITSIVVNLLMVLAVAGLVGEVRKPDPPPVVAYQETWVQVNGGVLTVKADSSLDWQPLPDVTLLQSHQTTDAVWRCLILQKRNLAAWRPESPRALVITPTRSDIRACGGNPGPPLHIG